MRLSTLFKRCQNIGNQSGQFYSMNIYEQFIIITSIHVIPYFNLADLEKMEMFGVLEIIEVL